MEGQHNRKILAIAVGGAGINIAKSLMQELPELNMAAIDTDAQCLHSSGIKTRLAIGNSACGGNGTGGDPHMGKAAASESADEIEKLAASSDFIIIICGLGGGTGSMLAPIIAKLAGENASIVCFCVMPLKIEGEARNELAKKALSYLRRKCSAAFELPNDIILARQTMPIADAYKAANGHVTKAASAMVKMLSNRGIVNIDFPTFDRVFSKRGADTFIAYASASGEDACDKAVADMLKSPLFKNSERGAESLLLSLTCGSEFEMNKMQYLLESSAAALKANGRIAFAALSEPAYGDKIEICAMGTYKHLDSGGIHANAETASIPYTETPGRNDSIKVCANPPKGDHSHVSIAASENISEAQDGNLAGKAADIEPIPTPVVDERKKTRRSFFGFGRKQKDGAEQDGAEKSQQRASQGEFKFMEMSEQRGFFEDTEKNIRNGVDLDVPTYMRRGIKIVL